MRTFIQIIFFLNLVIFVGCVSSSSNTYDRKEFNLNLILSSPINSPNEKNYPTNLSSLFLPYCSGCKTSFFVPNVFLYRTDLNKHYSFNPNFTTIGWMTSQMRSLGNNTDNPNSIKGDILNNINNQKIPDSLLIKSTKEIDLQFLIDSLLKKNIQPVTQIIILSDVYKDSIIILSQNKFHVFSDTASIRKYVNNIVCRDDGVTINIIYNPNISVNRIDTLKDAPKDTTVKVHTPLPHPPPKPGVSPPHGKGHGKFIIDCGTYDGDTYDGKPNGAGTMYYSQSCRISPYDNKERNAEVGDYITGHWKDGYLDVGTWYDKNGNEKAVLTIGVHQ